MSMARALALAALVLLACCAAPPVRTPVAPSVVAVAPAQDGKLAPRVRAPADAGGVRLVPQLQHTENIDTISYSPDGSLALTTGDGSLKVWDPSTLTLLRTMNGHTNRVEAAYFLPDGRRALSASQDGTLRLWDTTAGATLLTYPGKKWVTSLAVSADGRRAVSGDLDGKVKLWEIEEGLRPTRTAPVPLRSIDAHPEGSVAVGISSDRRVYAAAGGDGIKLWDSETGALLRTMSSRDAAKPMAVTGPNGNKLSITMGAKESIEKLVFSPDGSRLLAVSWSAITVWEVATGTRVRRIEIEDLRDVRFFKDGRRVVVACAGADRLAEWDIETGARLRVFPVAKEAFLSVALSPDERRITAGSSTGEIQVLRVYDEATGELLADKSSGAAGVWSAAFSHDGARVVAACNDGAIRVWDTHGVRLERTIAGKKLMPSSVAVSPDNRLVLSGGWDRNLRAWNVETGAEAVDYTGEGKSPIDAVAWGPDGKRVVAAMGKDVSVWDAAGGAPLHTMKSDDFNVHAITFLDATRFVSGNHDGTLKVWDTETGALVQSFGDEKVNESFFATAGAPDHRHVAGAGRNGNIYVWDLGEPAAPPVVIPNAHPGYINGLAFSPDGKRLLSGGYDSTLKLWDLATGKLERSFPGHENRISTVSFSPDGLYGLSSSFDEATRMWRLDDGYSMTMTGRQGSWLVYTSDGYFDASRRGGELVGAVQGNRGFRIDQLALSNNRPDRIMEEMGFVDGEASAYYRTRFQRRVQKLGLSEERLATSFTKAPTARILGTKTENGFAEVTFELADPEGKLYRYNVYVNDVPLLGMLGKPITGGNLRSMERVELGAGQNKIEIGVLNASGAEALRPFVIIDGKQKPKGDLYYLGFGVSQYMNPRYDLAYSHKDVLDLAEVFKTKHDAYREVHIATYVNEEATVANVKKAKEFLRSAKTDDTVVLFVSGHGLHSSAATAEYYYATYEVDPKRLAATAANFELIEELLQGIAPRRKLFLMDTCESGEAEVSRSVRSFAFDRDRYIENDLARRSGAIVLSSSRGAEHSFELEELQNGVFTEAILMALTTPAADRDRDGTVSTDELRAFVAREVGRLTDDKQHPTVDRDNLDMKFGLPVITAAHGIQTRPDPMALRPRPVPVSPPPPVATRAPQGCGCRAAPSGSTTSGLAAAFGLAVVIARRRSARHRWRNQKVHGLQHTSRPGA